MTPTPEQLKNEMLQVSHDLSNVLNGFYLINDPRFGSVAAVAGIAKANLSKAIQELQYHIKVEEAKAKLVKK